MSKTREERRRRKNGLRDVAFLLVCVAIFVGAAFMAEWLAPEKQVEPSVTAYALEVRHDV